MGDPAERAARDVARLLTACVALQEAVALAAAVSDQPVRDWPGIAYPPDPPTRPADTQTPGTRRRPASVVR